jgi:ribosomal protein S18 acetylase RimI-like enzyme
LSEPAPAALRPAEERDAAAVTALWTIAYVDEGEGGRTAPYAGREFAATAARAAVTVAERLGRVVGVVALTPPGAPDPAVAEPGEAELSRLAVAPGQRRLGIGRLLVAGCGDSARAEGWPAIALWSRPYQVAAHRLYESLGYKRVPGRDRSDETGHRRLVFRLDLQRSE